MSLARMSPATRYTVAAAVLAVLGIIVVVRTWAVIWPTPEAPQPVPFHICTVAQPCIIG